jgi:hypothetical protein
MCLEMVKRGKDRCKKCGKGRDTPPTGISDRYNGKLMSKHIGKTEDPEEILTKELACIRIQCATPNPRTQREDAILTLSVGTVIKRVVVSALRR